MEQTAGKMKATNTDNATYDIDCDYYFIFHCLEKDEWRATSSVSCSITKTKWFR